MGQPNRDVLPDQLPVIVTIQAQRSENKKKENGGGRRINELRSEPFLKNILSTEASVPSKGGNGVLSED